MRLYSNGSQTNEKKKQYKNGVIQTHGNIGQLHKVAREKQGKGN